MLQNSSMLIGLFLPWHTDWQNRTALPISWHRPSQPALADMAIDRANKRKKQNIAVYNSAKPNAIMLRSYHAENARSRPIPEANLHWARLVLR